MDATEYVQGVRAFADWIERIEADHPGTFSETTDLDGTGLRMLVYCIDRDEFIDKARKLDGDLDTKEGDYANCTRQFGPVTVQLYTSAEHVSVGQPRQKQVIEYVLEPEVIDAIKAAA